MKRCCRCGQDKPEDQFNAHFYKDKQGNRRQGLASWCKTCHRAYLKERTKTPEYREYQREYLAKNRDRINAKYRERYQINAEERRVKNRKYTTERELSISSYLKRLASHKRRHTEVVCDIDGEYLLELYNKQDGRCVLTGRKMIWRIKVQQTNAITSPNTLSIDRIIPSLGYTRGNVRLIIWQANHARMMFSDADLISLCRDILATVDTPVHRATQPAYEPMQ